MHLVDGDARSDADLARLGRDLAVVRQAAELCHTTLAEEQIQGKCVCLLLGHRVALLLRAVLHVHLTPRVVENVSELVEERPDH